MRRIAAVDGWFNRIRQVAAMCPPMRANTIELVLPLAHPSPKTNGKSIGSAVFAQFTAESPYTLQWDALPPSKLPSPMGDLHPHLIHGSLGPPESLTKQHLDRFSRLCRAH